jgi:hypothetical protein
MTSNTEKSAGDANFSKRKADKFLESIRVDDAERLRKLKNYTYFIILPDDSFKMKWDLLITL